MAKKWINVAVVGCGHIYHDAHKNGYESKFSTNNVVIGLCDTDEKRAKEECASLKKSYEKRLKKEKDEDQKERLKYGIDNMVHYTDFGKMLDKLEALGLDLVDNCTHGRNHVPLAVQAMNHGVNAMAEKPPALNWWDAKRTVEAEKKSKKCYQLMENVCYERNCQESRRVITAGKIGTLENVTIQFGHGGPYVPYVMGETGLPHFIDPLLCGGGTLQDLGPHGISRAFWPIGSGTRLVSCQTKILERRKNPRVMSGKNFTSPVDDWAEATLEAHDPRTNKNFTMEITTSWCGGFSFPFTITTDKGDFSIGKNPKTRGDYDPVLYPEDGDPIYFPTPEDNWEPHAGHTREIQFFCNNLLQGKSSDTPAEYALRLEELISSHYVSKLLKKKVTLEEMEKFGEEQTKGISDSQAQVDKLVKEMIKAVDLK